MDHSYIDGAGLVDLYVRGRMPVDDRVAFEEHFLDCRECLEQLEIARSFMEGVRITATKAAERPKASRLSFGGWITSLGSWRTAGLVVAACLIVLAVPVALLVKQLEDTRNELGWEKSASTILHRQYASDLAALKMQFEVAEQVGPAVLVLNEVRGLDTAQVGPANRITIPKSPRWIVLAIERDFSQYRTYIVTVQNRDGKTVWQQDNIKPSSPEAIGVSLPSSILSPGDYTVSLAARSPAGKSQPPSSSFATRQPVATGNLGATSPTAPTFVPLAKYSFRAAQ